MRTLPALPLVALAVAWLTACTDDHSHPLTPSGPAQAAFSEDGASVISGHVFVGTGTRNLCSAIGDGSTLEPRAIALDGSFFDQPGVTFCPMNDFSIAVTPGSYFVRIALPPVGQFPERWLEPGLVTVEQGEVTKDVHVRNGSPFLGRATLDGAPVAGVDLQVLYENLPGHGAAFGVSGPTGEWSEDFGRTPMILQNNLDYTVIGCLGPYPGTRLVNGFPTAPIHFPGGTNRVDCNLVTGDALQYTHRASRLKLTSFPGDIGGMSDPIAFPELGFGYSAQFPLPPGRAPRAGPALINRQLFRGGLVLGIAPNVALGGTELAGFVTCSVSPCRALGFDGAATVRRGAEGKEITWVYTDAGSERPRGIQVRQRSFDGRNGADYVLYLFRIINQGSSLLAFTPGVFFDFDVGPELFSNTGYTALDGRLMVTAGQAGGPQFGSVILEPAPAHRNYFFDGIVSEVDLVAALRGDIRHPTAGPSDVHGLHGGLPARLGVGKGVDFWMAIVAGDTRAQIIANARAALADAKARRDGIDPFAGPQPEPIRSSGRLVPPAAASRSGRICKVGCRPPN